ncbi:lipase member M-like isoform X1 [Crotalus tigris]|uniref:lipase member M-like isoform X1 n=1 Tax=Crotalus tigris TaxID=88082 RepID=UPI00192FA407|nr:lipase member M-like isoform X1 [Crotalus tigris]XP_039191863.1 lipase member M-like isoform X1 [Crotalus tigris]
MWLVWVVICLIQQEVTSEKSINGRHLNPEHWMNISEIIQYWGYPSEEYEILTSDGYYLKANRIPNGIHSPEKTGPKPAVLLVSGFVTEGRSWLINLPRNSLGFVLADAGYDVWIINNRGTTWSRRHQNLTIDQEEFWNFSFHEMAIYDIPATINFILHKTKQDSLYYIGHSQGASLGLITFSAFPQLALKTKLLVCLAPPYTMKDLKGPAKYILQLPYKVKRYLWGNKDFRLLSNRAKNINAHLCSYPEINKICIQIIFSVVGFNQNNINVSRADLFLGSYPDFASVKTVFHWTQIFESNEFKHFDFGNQNKAIYNMTKPPFYKLEDITVPTAVWSGGNDFIVTPENINHLLQRLTNLIFHKYIPSWHHADFIWGLDAPKYLHEDIFHLMQNYK